MNEDSFSLFRVVGEYEGPPLRMVLAGAGSFAARIVEVPGASKVLDSIWIPYSRERLNDWIRSGPWDKPEVEKVKAVSEEMLDYIHWTNCTALKGAKPLSVTAAVSSKKQRQGENEAYIAVGGPAEIDRYHVKLHKLEDVDFEDENRVNTKRFIQDRMISEIALHFATGIPSVLTEEMMSAGYVRKLL